MSKIQEVLDDQVQPKVDALKKEEADLKPKIQDSINKLSDAIKASNRPLIERHLETLAQHKVGPYARIGNDARVLLAKLKTLKADENTPEGKRILAITKSLGELEGLLNRNFDRIKLMEDMANDVLEKQVADGGKAREEWAEMEGWLNTQLKAAELHLQAMEELEKLAKSAVADKDQADLTYAINKSKERSTWKPTQKEIQDKFAKFCTKCEASGLSKDLVEQLTRDRVKYKKLVDDLAALNKKMDDIQQRVQLSYIAKVDIKALARALKISDPKAVDRLKLALRPTGDARGRALRGMQNDFNLKFSPKDFETLMNATVE